MIHAAPLDLSQALQLMRSGNLMEATSAIQRALRPQVPPVREGRVIDAEFSRVEAPQRARPETETGQFIRGNFTGAAGTRPYKLYVPSGHAGGPLPLVVMLHGCTQSPDDFAAGTRMNELAEERRCVVLYPEQTRAANGSCCWNWFRPGDQQRGRGEPAILAGMTEEVKKRYGIDARRVYVAGLSAGGAMAAVLGATYPELYAAVGVHSGLAAGSAHDVPSAFAAMRGAQASPRATDGARGVPLILFHGDSDTTVHPSNSDRMILDALGRNVESKRRSVERGRAPGGRPFTRTTYRDSAGRCVLESWLVEGAAHSWSGGSTRGSYTDPKGPDASRAMVEFFSKHSVASAL